MNSHQQPFPRPSKCLLLPALYATALVTFPVFAQDPGCPAKPASPFAGVAFRQIGPFRGGRVGAVTGVQSQPMTLYFGATGGGIFKTTGSGIHWHPVTDGQLKLVSVGAIADSDPNTVYAGMGEADLRGNALHEGVYKSIDATQETA